MLGGSLDRSGFPSPSGDADRRSVVYFCSAVLTRGLSAERQRSRTGRTHNVPEGPHLRGISVAHREREQPACQSKQAACHRAPLEVTDTGECFFARPSVRMRGIAVIADHLIQDARRGLPWLVRRQRRGHASPSAEPMPRRASPETGGCSGDSVSGKAVAAHVIGTAGGSRSSDPFVRPGQASRPRQSGDRADLRRRADCGQTDGSSRCRRMTNLGQHPLEI